MTPTRKGEAMPDDHLTPQEIAKLRLLLPYAEAVSEEAEYHAAVRLLLRRWKGIVIWLAAVIAAGVAVGQHIKAAIQTFLGITP
jgi:hypothetical protein